MMDFAGGRCGSDVMIVPPFVTTSHGSQRSKSPIGMTSRLAAENEWDVGSMERREDEIADQVLARWPWPEQTVAPKSGATFRWRIEDGPWHSENVASQMVLNVAGALLSQAPINSEKLSGDALSSNVHSAEHYPSGATAGTLTMRAVPGHARYVMYPYEASYAASAKRCRKMGERCGVLDDPRSDERSGLGGNLEKQSEESKTVTVQRRWTRDDEREWREAAQWIIEQHERLRAILADPS